MNILFHILIDQSRSSFHLITLLFIFNIFCFGYRMCICESLVVVVGLIRRRWCCCCYSFAQFDNRRYHFVFFFFSMQRNRRTQAAHNNFFRVCALLTISRLFNFFFYDYCFWFCFFFFSNAVSTFHLLLLLLLQRIRLLFRLHVCQSQVEILKSRQTPIDEVWIENDGNDLVKQLLFLSSFHFLCISVRSE